jgi:hypothetical protein
MKGIYFLKDKDCYYWNKEYLIVKNFTTKKVCGHHHYDPKQAIKCLLSFKRLEKGFELVYVVEPEYRNPWKWDKNTGKMIRTDLEPLPPLKELTFTDMPFGLQKKIKESFLTYRTRYNVNVPENLFDYTMTKENFDLLKQSLQEALLIEKNIKMKRKKVVSPDSAKDFFEKNKPKTKEFSRNIIHFELEENNAFSEEIFLKIDEMMKLGVIKNVIVINAPKKVNKL